MGWQDRDYAPQDRPGFGESPFRWLLYGRVPLFRAFGVDVTLHASFIVVVALVVIFGTPFGADPLDRVVFVAVLFGVVLLHEFGHVFGARASGGEARDIELTPLGGLAFAMPGRGWWPLLVTVACGPLVNVVICLVCAAGLYATVGTAPLGPYQFGQAEAFVDRGTASAAYYLYFVYAISYFLLLFNLLPVYPLDGGKLLQAALWSRLSWYRATLIATAVGMVGAVLMVLWGIASAAAGAGGLLLALIGASCFFNCFQLHKMLKAEGPWGFGDQDEPDWSASLRDGEDDGRPSWRERRAERREERDAARRAAAEAAELAELDDVLAKVSRSGLASLTRGERRVLERATARRRGR